MRQHQWAILFVTGSFLMGMASCAADSAKPSAETPPPSQITQAEQGKDQPPSGEVQKRALPRVTPGTGPRIMTPQPPPPTSGPSTGRLGPSGIAVPPGGLAATPGPTYVGPTPNITAVANAMAQYYKSLTTLTTFKPGLVLTQPVTISIAYLSPAGYGPGSPERLTQTYAQATGNHFLRNDNEGNGQPRRVHLDINLSEPKPGGGLYSYNVPVDMDLDPLYDVSITPLVFTLIMGCVGIGANHIALDWYPPDVTGNYQTVNFNAVNGEMFTINEFNWARQEVSASANFHQPLVWYAETSIHCDLFGGGCPFGAFPGGSGVPLVPGKTYSSSPGLVSSLGATQDCKATLNYTVTYTLRWYPYLGP